MLKFELSDRELYEVFKDNLTEKCPNQTYPEHCQDGKVSKRYIEPDKAGRRRTKYREVTCDTCSGKGVVLTNLGRLLVEFVKRWC